MFEKTLKLFRLSPVRAAVALLAACCAPLAAQAQVAPTGAALLARISVLQQEKESRTPTQQKIGSQLWYALQSSRGQANDTFADVYRAAKSGAAVNASGIVQVRIQGAVSESLKAQIARAGGSVQHVASTGRAIDASVPLGSVESLAALPDVSRIVPAARPRTNVGALTSQGYISHKANLVVNAGIDGTGVRVGVLSDSAQGTPALISSGDLPPDTLILPGQAGPTDGSSEGSAIMEIIHDLAPGAKLFFATAFTSEQSFADNIRTLRDVYHCDVIVDDVSYSEEGVFQDDIVAQAVNDVTAAGALYFSSAANSGNLTSGTSGTWEGDFKPAAGGGGSSLHLFSPTQPFDVLTGKTTDIVLQWSDPLGASTNDYDLFVLNADGTQILCSSTDVQSGAGSNPVEECYDPNGYAAGSLVVVARKAGSATRGLHVDTERGMLSIATSGATFGHNAGKNTVSMAATFWNSARTGTKAFPGGAANPTETFSSDGPRRIFFNPDGSAITPGNFLFSTSGGTLLTKPDLTAADGVSTKTPGFLPFFGTSAAAPHAGAVAALVKSARPDYTNVQILQAMKATALDIRGAGVDRDSGYGITMAKEAVDYAKGH